MKRPFHILISGKSAKAKYCERKRISCPKTYCMDIQILQWQKTQSGGHQYGEGIKHWEQMPSLPHAQ